MIQHFYCNKLFCLLVFYSIGHSFITIAYEIIKFAMKVTRRFQNYLIFAGIVVPLMDVRFSKS